MAVGLCTESSKRLFTQLSNSRLDVKIYSDENPPRKGTGLKIYQALKAEGWRVEDLHYNPPAWGKLRGMGYGTWACQISGKKRYWELWCGIQNGVPYLESCTPPYNRYVIEGSFQVIG